MKQEKKIHYTFIMYVSYQKRPSILNFFEGKRNKVRKSTDSIVAKKWFSLCAEQTENLYTKPDKDSTCK